MNKRRILHKMNRAITLVELLVVMVVGIMVLGLILQMFISTNLATKKANIEAIMLQEATLIAHQLESALDAWVAEQSAYHVEEMFKDAKLQFARVEYEGTEKRNLVVSTFQNQSLNGRTRIVMINRPLRRERSEAEEPRPSVLGLNEPRIATNIRFSYASKLDGFNITWLNEITPPERPILIRYTITVSDLQHLVKPLQLTSSVRVLK
ncbi:hypothetical protein J7M23_12405 [Candidatus Sumerlaeota bacterium]|nr:hypothetical protein [Candidatus Sumerlaeota bacterium]